MLGHQADHLDHLLAVVEQRAGRPRRGLRRRLRPRAAAGRRGPARRRDLRPAGRLPGPGRGHQRQPRLRPAPRLRLPPDRRGRGPPPHRRRRASARRCCSTTSTAPVAVYGIPYLDPDHLREPWSLPARSHEAALREAMARIHFDIARRRTALAAQGGARARLRRRGADQRLRARHPRRRRLAGAHRGLRGRRLRRARPPARAAHPDRPRALQRVPARLLLLRGRPGQGVVAGRPRRRRLRPGRVRRGAGAAAARPAARRPRRRCSPTPASPSTSSRGCRRRSPTTSARSRRWSGCGGGSPTPSCSASSPPTRRGRPPRRSATAGRDDHTIALDFVADLRGHAGHRRPSRGCCATRSRRAATTATSTPCSPRRPRRLGQEGGP